MHLLFAWSCARGHGCYKCEQSRIAFQSLSEREKGVESRHQHIYMCNVFMFVCLFGVALGLGCCAQAFSSCGEQGLLCCSVWAPHCSGFFCCGAQAVGAHGLQ